MTEGTLANLASQFERFGRIETPGASPLYAPLALAVAEDVDLLALAGHCRPGQPAPNLFLGAVHYLLLGGKGKASGLHEYYPSLRRAGEPPQDEGLGPSFRGFCLEHAGEISKLVSTRFVQTNEVGRCAALLPAFGFVAENRRPLALIEIGASAGLNLLWDRYGYSYSAEPGTVVARLGDFDSPVQLHTILRGHQRPPFPSAQPPVASRIGIDLHPVDARDEDAVAWLRALIWPEHKDRVATLLAAAELARSDPPQLLPGNALDLLPQTLAVVPRDLLPVVVHTFTLNQLSDEARLAVRSILRQSSREREILEVGIEMVRGAAHAGLAIARYRESSADVQHLARCDGHVRWLEWYATGRS